MKILKIMYNENKFLPLHICQEKKTCMQAKVRSIFIAISVHMKRPKKKVLKRALVLKFES